MEKENSMNECNTMLSSLLCWVYRCWGAVTHLKSKADIKTSENRNK